MIMLFQQADNQEQRNKEETGPSTSLDCVLESSFGNYQFVNDQESASSPVYSLESTSRMEERVSTPLKPSTKVEKLKMSWKLIEESIADDMQSNNSNLESIRREMSIRLQAVKSSTQNLAIPKDMQMDMEEIWARLIALERKVNDFPTSGQATTATLSQITQVLEKLSQETTEVKNRVGGLHRVEI